MAGTCPCCALTRALSISSAPEAVADYVFLAELGRGAMGVVSLARQLSLDRLVAVKVIAAGSRPVAWLEERLLREARAAAQLQHPNIVAVNEVGQGPAGAFLAMEYCEGGDLRASLGHRPLAPRAAASLAAKLADAITHAHAAGVLHRDLKPSNILLTGNHEPKISDFGLTAAAAGGETTQTTEAAGSPSYLAPETLQAGIRPAPAVDVYGLGAILYECLTGRPPFTGNSVAGILAQIAQTEPIAPRALSREVPSDLETIVLKCLAKDPAGRYASAAALRDDLQNFLAGRPIVARPVSPAGRLRRWAGRNPALAATSATLLLLLIAVAVGSTFAAIRLRDEQRRTAAERDRTIQAEAATREQLRAALLAQARATRFAAREGQRFNALAALRQAAAIHPGEDLRSEAIAALTLPDWSPHTRIKAWSDPGRSRATPLPGFAAFIHENESGVFTRRTFPEGKIEWTWPGRDSSSAGQTVVSPDGRWLAVRLLNDEIHVLDAANGRPLFQLGGRPYLFKESGVRGFGADMAFSPDGSRFAATRPEGGVTIHRLPEGTVVGEWTTPAALVALAFSHDASRLAAGGAWSAADNVVALLDAATGRELARDVPPSRVDFLEWSADDRWLAVGSRPVQVRAAFDLSLRAVVPDKAALYAHFLPDGDRLLLTEQVGQTRLWNIDSGRLLLLKQDSGSPGMWYDGVPPRQWRAFTSGEVDLQTFHESPILVSLRPSYPAYTVPDTADPLDISPDGQWLLLGGWGGPLLIDLAHNVPVSKLKAGPESSAAVARFDADGAAVWIGQTGGPLLRRSFAVGPDGKPAVGPGEIVPGHEGFLPTALHRATGILALTHLRAGRVRLLETRTRQVTVEWESALASRIAFSPDGSLLLANAEPGPAGRAEIRDTVTGKRIRTLGDKAGRIAAWSPDGHWLLAGTDARAMALWHPDTWAPGPALPAALQWYDSAATFSPDTRLLVVRQGQDLVVLRPATLELIARIEMPDSVRNVPGLRFTEDGRRLIVARGDGRVDLWDFVAMRAELAQLGLNWTD